MSIIVTFFAAPDDAAALSTLNDGPGGTFESLEYGNFLPEEAMVDWEALFTNRNPDFVDGPRYVVDPGEGWPTILAASKPLHEALLGADAARLTEVGEIWRQQRAEEGDDFDPELVSEILSELADLARTADRRGNTFYCWIA